MVYFIGSITYAQFACPIPNGPNDGDTDVPVDTVISWDPVEGVPGYLISVGTSPGGTDIAKELDTGSTSFIPPFGLPERTKIYVTLTLFFFDRENIKCSGFSFTTEEVTTIPDCTRPRSPIEGSTDVAISSTISWDYAPKATGYRLTLGLSEGAGDILDNEEIVKVTFYKPITDFPPNAVIFARIIPYNGNGDATGPCESFRFTTRATENLPGCTSLVNPADGAFDVSLNPILEWPSVPDASGYKVSIGSSATENNVLDNVVFTANSTPVVDFEPNQTFFATVIPFNSAGSAIGCKRTSFTTIPGCDVFVEGGTGERISLAPEIDFPEMIYVCQNETPLTVTSNDAADGYRWFKVKSDSTEELLSTSSEVLLSEPGTYRYEAYNTIQQAENIFECESFRNFTVILSEIAIIPKLEVTKENELLQITVRTEGMSDYIYALDSLEGPYQSSNIFENISIAVHTVYVQDKNGCGVASETFEPDLSLIGFPKFFTPNGDGVNDFWQFLAPTKTGGSTVQSIFIFDRYGNLLAQINPDGPGWNGTFDGRPMPASSYWFKSNDIKNKEIVGYFALKR